MAKLVILFLLALILISNKSINLAFANFGIPSLADITNPAPIISPNNGISRNWAGYVAQNGTYTSASGNWIVPTPSGQYGSDAAWVGIGGVSGNDLIQVGTQETVSRNGQTGYEAFYETLPNVSKSLQVNINAGDSISASVNEQPSGEWQISLKDNSNGQSAQVSVPYNSSLSSAEWIEEAPSGTRNILPLDNFGTINFSQGLTVKDGQTETISSSGATALKMGDNRGQLLATTSSLGPDGASFSVTRTSTSSTVSTPTVSVKRVSSRGGSNFYRFGFGFRTFRFRYSFSNQK